MIRRISSLILCAIILFLVSISSFSAYAQDASVEGVFINKPDITFYLSNYVENVIDVKLNDELVNVNSVSKYDIDKYSVAAYVLVDVSGSIPNEDVLNVFKDELIAFAKTFGQDDKFVLYTMGDSAKEILSGGEGIDQVEKAIRSLKRTNENSYIYDTLNIVYDNNVQPANYDRQFVLVISDGINYSNKTSYEKIYKKYITHSLPVYSLLYSNGEIDANRSYISEFNDLVSDSGGYTVRYTENDGKGKLTSLIDKINDKTVVKCSAKNNTVNSNDSNNILSFNCDGNSVEIKSVFVTSNQIDDVSPEINEIAYDKISGNFVITFSENIIANTEKITVSKNDKNIKITSCTIEDNKLIIKPKEEIYTGKYTFDLGSVTDNSNEKNSLKQSSVTEKVKSTNVFLKILKDFWWILIIILLLVAILLILLFVKNKKNVKTIKEIFETQVEEENVEVKHTQVVKKKYYNNPQVESQKLSMIVEFNGNKNKVEMNVVSSVIVGRSSECDICIEDTKLSRQHFAIEIINNKFVISDLNTTNGTFVNGTKVSTKQLLLSGDKVLAGTSLFIVL